MYRLVLYYRVFSAGRGGRPGFTSQLDTDPYSLLFTTASWWPLVRSKWILRAFRSDPGAEVRLRQRVQSAVISPIQTYHDLWFLGWASVWAMASSISWRSTANIS